MKILNEISKWLPRAWAFCVAATTLCAVCSARHTSAAPVLSPGLDVVQLSNNGLPGFDAPYRGYPQVSGDGSTVYFISGGSVPYNPYRQDLMRWRIGKPLETIVTLESQQYSVSVSRPSTNYDGTRVSYRSRIDPQGDPVNPRVNASLFLYEEGQGIREVFNDPDHQVDDPMMTPDGSSVYFTASADVDGTNPRNEKIGCRYEIADETVTPVLTYTDPSIIGDANAAYWRGVSNTDRQLVNTNGQVGSRNSGNWPCTFALDEGQPTVLEIFTRAHRIYPLDRSKNLQSRISDDGRFALFSDVDENVHLIDLVTNELTAMPFTSRQRDYVISGNGDYVIYANIQTPVSLFRWERATGNSELLLTQDAKNVDWHLSTDFTGNRIAFRSPNDLTGDNPGHDFQVFLMTVPEPSTFALFAMGAGVLLFGCFRRRKPSSR